MATLQNWLSVNSGNDLLTEDQGRTLLGFINDYENEIEQTLFEKTLAEYTTHITETDNPHHVRFANLGTMIVEALFTYYNTVYVPTLSDPSTALTHDAFVARLTIQPVLVFELIRQYLLNKHYLAIDGEGPLPSTAVTPFYTFTTEVSPSTWFPFYSSTLIAPDAYFSYYSTLTRPLDMNASGTFTLFGSLYAGSGDIWSLQLGTDLLISYHPDTKAFQIDEVSGTSFQGTDDPNRPQFGINSDPTFPNELRFAFVLSPTGFKFYYYTAGTLTLYTTSTRSPFSTLISELTLSHGMWDGISSVTGTTGVVIYPGALAAPNIEVLLGNFHFV